MTGRILRRAWPVARRVGREVYGYSSFVRSFARLQPHYIAERWDGTLDLRSATRVAVFSHFDPRGVIHDFVRYYLRQIWDAGYTIVFVSNAPRLRRVDVDWLGAFCGAVIRRKNVGLDFGGFKDGIASIPDVGKLESLLLANDSVYGPFYDLGQVIARMDPAEADVWGITDSWERRFHLQSFFLLFTAKALASEAFHTFWRRLRHVQAKYWVISRYEIGLTRALVAGGVHCRALFPFRAAAAGFAEATKDEGKDGDVLKSSPEDERQKKFRLAVLEAIDVGVPLNSTHFFWEYLIVAMGCPFIKRELLRKNPVKVPGLVRWEDVIRSVSHYDPNLIVRHLEVSMRNRVV